MPGVLLPNGVASSLGADIGMNAGMKRAHPSGGMENSGQPTPSKKRKVTHGLQHKQPVHHVVDPVSAEFDPFGDSKDFFDHQLRRAIAIQCKSIGFDSARPDALEEMRALVVSCTISRVPGYIL